MARKIVITSGKGGVGKTTFCANLGFALSSLNKKVVLIDMDFGLNNLDVVCGIENDIIYDIVDVALGKCRTSQALVSAGGNNLFVLPSCNGQNRNLISTQSLKQIINVLDQSFDFILFDCPAGIDDGFYKATQHADEAIIVTTPHISAIRDADKVLTILLSNNILDVSLVINRVRGDLILEKQMLSVEEISSLFKCELLGVIPESDSITSNLNLGLFSKDGDIGKAFNLCAKKVLTCRGEIFDCTSRYRGVFGAFKRRLKRI